MGDTGNKTEAGMVYDLPDSLDSTNNQICLVMDILDFKVHSFGYFAGESPFFFPFPVLILQIFICMSLTRVLYYLLRPLRQPRIIAELLVCILMSPTAIGSIEVKTGICKQTLWSVIYPGDTEAVTNTLADTGIMFYLFIIGVKMDPSIVVNMGRKVLIIGVSSLIFPFTVVAALFYFLREQLSVGIAHSHFMVSAVSMVSITASAVLADVLLELNLLNSELGRLALACSMVHGVYAFVAISLFIATNQGHGGWIWAASALFSLASLVAGIVFVFRPWMLHIARTTPKGGRVEDRYIVAIFVIVLAMGMASDFIGVTFTILPLVMGLAVPEGPPLGSALASRAQLLANEVAMPLLFLLAGRDLVFNPLPHSRSWSLLLVLFTGCVVKVVATMVSAMYCLIPIKNAFLLGLIMNFSGVVDVLNFLVYRLGNLLDKESYTIMILAITLTTGIAAPLVTALYKPMGCGYKASRCSIQHLKPNSELRILACVHNKDPIPYIVNLLEASCPTLDMPLCIYVLHLVELEGRSNSSLIAHKNKKGFINPSGMDCLHNIFTDYEQNKKGYVAVQPFTSVSPFKTMHQDICSLAAQKHVALIVVPFRRVTALMMNEDVALRSNIPQILTQAPCSVGILIYPDDLAPTISVQDNSQHYIGVLFWGGPDDREALSYASRMVRRDGVSLTIIHFIQHVDQRDSKQRQLDDDLLSRLRFEHMNNEHVVIDEIVVKDVEQTITVIKSLDNSYNLMIVGRRQGPNSLLEEGLADWSECPEVGVVGDMLASKDFGSSTTILVMQQQT